MNSPLFPLGNSVLAALDATSAPVRQWVAVADRFRQFHLNVLPTGSQLSDGRTKFAGVVRSLNAHYYGISSESDNAFFVGAWGKTTMTRPPRDVDIFFVLPTRSARASNRTSGIDSRRCSKKSKKSLRQRTRLPSCAATARSFVLTLQVTTSKSCPRFCSPMVAIGFATPMKAVAIRSPTRSPRLQRSKRSTPLVAEIFGH